MSFRVAGTAIGMGAFVSTHTVLSYPPIRQDIIDKIGADRFNGLYSLIALGTLVPTTIFYARYARGTDLQLYNGTSLLQRIGGFTFKALGAVTLSQAITQGSPIVDLANKPSSTKITEEDVKVQGIYRFSRHSMFMSFAFLGVGNLLTRGHLSDVIYWGSFPAYWIIGSTLQDERLKSTFPAAYFEQTSLLPGKAMIEGKQSVTAALSEMSPKATIIALIAPIFFL
ncbi:hypothetical protein BASA83_001098 [Batrachochytrium salamandrivorans]|nr:hypothetical protein BASA83_001098 [Batrachochytrium salamandrivorans]